MGSSPSPCEAGRGLGRGVFYADLIGPPLPGPLLHFVEEREKSPSDLTPVALIQWQWGKGEGDHRATSQLRRNR